MRIRAIVLLALSAAVYAQEIEVSGSSGVAEIEVPGSGWLQAVSGRPAPDGARLATWVDATTGLTIVEADAVASVRLGPLSVVRLVSGTVPIVLELLAGSVSVDSNGIPVEIRVLDVTIAVDAGAFLVAEDRVHVEAGEVAVRWRGDRLLLPGASEPLRRDAAD